MINSKSCNVAGNEVYIIYRSAVFSVAIHIYNRFTSNDIIFTFTFFT